MSAKDAPLAYRAPSQPTLIGVIDQWHLRRDWIRQRAVHARTLLGEWSALRFAAEEWEKTFRGS